MFDRDYVNQHFRADIAPPCFPGVIEARLVQYNEIYLALYW